jgi:pSer/pThr/pTyr-binding forkhead associated (FHA) protein
LSVIVCSACGKENEDFFMFCLDCGADLSAAPARATPAPVAPQAKAKTGADTADLPGGKRGRHAQATREWDPDVVELVRSMGPAALELMKQAAVQAPVVAKAVAPRRCPACDAVILAGQPFCPSCGARLGAAQKASPERDAAGRLVLIREDGSDGDRFTLYRDQTVIGRSEGDIKFPDDEFLGNKHAIFYYDGSVLYVQPLDTTNGVFRRIENQIEIASGDSFRIGQELLFFKSIADVTGDAATAPDAEGTLPLGSPLHEETWGWLGQRVGHSTYASGYLLQQAEVFLGRERGDILFPEDGYVSGSHAVVAKVNRSYYLKDLGSSNGTYLRLHAATALEAGDLMLSGQQLFRVEP